MLAREKCFYLIDKFVICLPILNWCMFHIFPGPVSICAQWMHAVQLCEDGLITIRPKCCACVGFHIYYSLLLHNLLHLILSTTTNINTLCAKLFGALVQKLFACNMNLEQDPGIKLNFQNVLFAWHKPNSIHSTNTHRHRPNRSAL